jgi:hypothetical protein
VFITDHRASCATCDKPAGGKEKKTTRDERLMSVATATMFLGPGFEPEIKATAMRYMLRGHDHSLVLSLLCSLPITSL